MFDPGRTGKKKSLTDPVQINPFPGQRDKRPKKQQPSVKNKVEEPTEEGPSPLKKKKRVSLSQRSNANFKSAQPSIAELKQETQQKKAEEKDLDAIDESAPSEDYSHDDFMKVWKKIMRQQDERGNKTVAVGMKNVTLEPGFIVRLKLENNVQESKILEHRVDIVETLREALNNGRIRLKTEVVIQETPKSEFSTSKEKFEKMAQKNPALHKLRKKFKLDIDL